MARAYANLIYSLNIIHNTSSDVRSHSQTSPSSHMKEKRIHGTIHVILMSQYEATQFKWYTENSPYIFFLQTGTKEYEDEKLLAYEKMKQKTSTSCLIGKSPSSRKFDGKIRGYAKTKIAARNQDRQDIPLW